jgi:C-terminal processing protease CtpA/Prc
MSESVLRGFGHCSRDFTGARVVSCSDGLLRPPPTHRTTFRAGDIITHIDDEAIQGLGLNQAVEKMRFPGAA